MILAVLSDLPAQDGGSLKAVTMRDITAAEELEVTTASDLLDALYTGGTTALDELTLSERDMAVAALYRALYGETIECHVPCKSCYRKFEMQFALADWIAALRDGPEVTRTGPNAFRTGGVAFRLPLPSDLAKLEHLPANEQAASLRALCVLEGDPEDLGLEAAMMRAGPLLDDDIEATCPHCGYEQTFPVCLDDYLIAALARERAVVVREIHHIASCYRWSRAEIMALPRSVRREHVYLILSDMKPQGVSAWR
jgi:hypothetical protein